jgi:hypothetical protein
MTRKSSVQGALVAAVAGVVIALVVGSKTTTRVERQTVATTMTQTVTTTVAVTTPVPPPSNDTGPSQAPPSKPAPEFRTISLATLLNRDTHAKGIGGTLFRYAWKGQTDVNFGTPISTPMFRRNRTTCRSITLRGGSLKAYSQTRPRPELVVQREGRSQYTYRFTAGQVVNLPTLALSPGRAVVIKVRPTRHDDDLALIYLNGTAQCRTRHG